jgi:hypothetical protein
MPLLYFVTDDGEDRARLFCWLTKDKETDDATFSAQHVGV